jgi:hypothetical protein
MSHRTVRLRQIVDACRFTKYSHLCRQTILTNSFFLVLLLAFLFFSSSVILKICDTFYSTFFMMRRGKDHPCSICSGVSQSVVSLIHQYLLHNIEDIKARHTSIAQVTIQSGSPVVLALGIRFARWNFCPQWLEVRAISFRCDGRGCFCAVELTAGKPWEVDVQRLLNWLEHRGYVQYFLSIVGGTCCRRAVPGKCGHVAIKVVSTASSGTAVH